MSAKLTHVQLQLNVTDMFHMQSLVEKRKNLENLPETLILAQGPFSNRGWHRGPSLCLQVHTGTSSSASPENVSVFVGSDLTISVTAPCL